MRLSVASIPVGIIRVTQGRPLTTNYEGKKIVAALSLGVASLTMAIVFSVIDSIQIIARYKSSVTEGSEVLDLIQMEIDVVHISAYLFNVTNAERFISGLDHKIKLEEVGPFTYKELRTNMDVELDSQAETLRYTPKVRTEFIPELSIADPRDVNVTIPNLALLAFASKLSTYGILSHVGLNMLAAKYNSKSIINVSAQDYLWGYDDPLITLGNSLLPGWIDFDTMGILDRLYDKRTHKRYEVSSKDSDRFSVKTVDGCKGLGVRQYNDPSKRSKCNTFVNTYEGFSYPSPVTPDKPLRLFRDVFCRMLDLEYTGKRILENNVEVLSYKISDKNYKMNSENECLCQDGVSCVDGMSDLSACLYGLPFTLSKPHFSNSDPQYLERIEGLRPNSSEFNEQILIEPKIGMPIDMYSSLQLNLDIKDVRFNSEASPFANMVLPVAHFKLKQPKLMDYSLDVLRMMYYTGPRIVLGLQITLFLVSFLSFTYSLWKLYCNWRFTKNGGIAFQAVPLEGKSNPNLCVEIPLMEYEKNDNFSSRLTLSTGIDDLGR